MRTLPDQPQRASQAAPPCGTVAFSFLRVLWKPDGVFIAQQRWFRSHEAMYIVVFKQDLFLDELYSLRQGFGGSAPPSHIPSS